MTLWPGLPWFLTPSGAHPEDRSLGNVVWNAPLIAHSLEALWSVAIAALLLWLHANAFVWAFVLAARAQGAKQDDGVYGTSWVREIGWRLVIVAVVLVLVSLI